MKNVTNETPSVLSLHSKNAFLEILPEKGGCITRYCLKNNDNTIEILRPANPTKIIKGDPLEKASFPLIPFSNRIRRGKFTFQGMQIQLPLNFPPEINSIHGHGWEMPWDVVEVGDSFIILEYKYLPNEWPFAYIARQIFELNESNLNITIQIKNSGKTLMPAGLGIHPYFIRTPNSSVIAKTKQMWINDSEKIPYKLKSFPETKILSKGLNINENVLDNLFTGWNHKLKIEWPEWKVNLFLYTKDPLNYLILYTPFGEDYFCVEPVSNVTDAFNMMERNISGHGTKILKPGEILEGKVCFIPELY